MGVTGAGILEFNTPFVCPFCPLNCDDLRLSSELRLNVECPRASQAVGNSLQPSAARIDDAQVSEPQIGTWFRRLHSESERVIVLCNGVDLVTARALSDLQRSGRIWLRVGQTATQTAMRAAVSQDGTVSATLGDVRQHADLVWSIGSPQTQCPRLYDRIGKLDGHCKRVDWLTADAAQLADLAVALSRVDEEIDPATSADESGLFEAGVSAIAAEISFSRYLAVIVGPGAFQPGEATAAALLLNRIVMRLNEHRRAVMLQLDDAATMQAVSAWTSNKPVEPIDPIVAGDSASIGGERPVPIIRLGDASAAANCRVDLQIGGIDPGVEESVAFLPCADFGIHQPSAIIRGDGTVTLPLLRVADSTRPVPVERLVSILNLSQETQSAS